MRKLSCKVYFLFIHRIKKLKVYIIVVITSVNNKEYIKTIKQLLRSNQNSPFQKVVGFFQYKKFTGM